MKEERVEALVPQGATMMFCTHTQKELLWKKGARERVICAGGRAEMGREPPGQSKEARGKEEEPTV